MAAIRVVLAVYWLALTVLLLVPDPLKWLGIVRAPGPPGGRMQHFLLFGLLAVLVLASRLRLRRGVLLGLLVGYALVTESLQWFVPHRTVELLDFTENLLGLAAGWGLWWLISRGFGRRTSDPKGGASAS